ncbi:MAG: DUF6882 domain-containing protein [Kofleriaceae bacterium]
MTPEFIALLSEYGPIGFEKFVRMEGHLDLTPVRELTFKPSGVLQTGSDLFTLQLLGTYARSEKTWMWSWAFPEQNADASTMQLANNLHQYGRQNAIAELISPSLSSARAGRALSYVAAGMSGGDGVLFWDYGEGWLCAVGLHAAELDDTSPEFCQPIFETFAEQFPECDHRIGWQAYAHHYRLPITADAAGALVVEFPQGGALAARFDDEDRLASLTHVAISTTQHPELLTAGTRRYDECLRAKRQAVQEFWSS